LMRNTPKRNVMIDDVTIADLTATPRGATTVTTTLAEEPDGLAVALVRMPAGAAGTLKLRYAGVGQTFLVLSGTISCRASTYGALAVMFASGDDLPLTLNAGEQGADVLVVQFPGTHKV